MEMIAIQFGVDQLVSEAWAAHGAFVFARALAITRNFHDAEDVAQEVWMRIARSIEGFEQRSSLKTWLGAIVRNTALNARRRRLARPEAELADGDAGVDSGLAHPGERLDGTLVFESATAGMKARERKAFLMWHSEGCSFCEIGQALGLSAKNARLVVWRATRKFRSEIRREL